MSPICRTNPSVRMQWPHPKIARATIVHCESKCCLAKENGNLKQPPVTTPLMQSMWSTITEEPYRQSRIWQQDHHSSPVTCWIYATTTPMGTQTSWHAPSQSGRAPSQGGVVYIFHPETRTFVESEGIDQEGDIAIEPNGCISVEYRSDAMNYSKDHHCWRAGRWEFQRTTKD